MVLMFGLSRGVKFSNPSSSDIDSIPSSENPGSHTTGTLDAFPKSAKNLIIDLGIGKG